MGAINPKVNFSFLCDYASITNDGKLSMQGIFDSFSSGVFPFQQSVFYVVVNIAGVCNNDIFSCELVSDQAPSKKLAYIEAKVKAEPGKGFGFIGQFVNVTFERPGEYQFIFRADSKKVGNHQFSVK